MIFFDEVERRPVEEDRCPVKETRKVEAHGVFCSMAGFYANLHFLTFGTSSESKSGRIDEDHTVFSCVFVREQGNPLVIVLEGFYNSDEYQLQVLRPKGLTFQEVVARYESEGRFDVSELAGFEDIHILHGVVRSLKHVGHEGWTKLTEGHLSFQLVPRLRPVGEFLNQKYVKALGRFSVR